MSGTSGTIAIAVSAVDHTAAAIDAINARIATFGKRTQASMDRAMAPLTSFRKMVSTFGDVSGLNRVGSALGGIGRASVDANQKLGQVVPLLGVIGSAATVAGITRMVTAWSTLGSQVSFASQRIGISASALSGLQGAARLAGSTADELSSGMQTLGQTLYDVVGGRNVDATVMLRTLFGEKFRADAHTALELMPQIADKIHLIKDPFAQAQVATTLFGGAAEGLLPFLRKGAAGIREYVETARRYGAISDESALAANRLREAQAKVSLAVEGLRNRIAERLEPILTPLLTHFAEWLATSPQVAQGVDFLGQKVGRLGAYLSSVDWAAVGQTWERWGGTIANVVTALGGPQKVIEDLMILMAADFAIKVITPFLTLGTAIFTATTRLTALTAGMASLQGVGALSWAGKIGGLLGGLGLGAAGWEGLNLAEGATQPNSDGWTNFFHNLAFEGNPLHWTRSYHPGQAEGSSSGPPVAGRPVRTPGNLAADQSLPLEARALLDTIAGPESGGQYNVINGGRTFADMSHHPGWLNPATNSTAAGRYQDIGTTWDAANLAAGGGLDFSPISQDRGNWALARQTYRNKVNADLLTDLRNPLKRGRIQQALGGSDLWTTLNLAGYDANLARETAQNGRARLADPLATAPQAQGAPLQFGGSGPGGSASSTDSNATVRLHLDGPPGYKARVLSNPQGVDIGGPLVERPQLLGANP